MAEPPRIDVVVLGASAGGIEALERVVRGLPASLPVPVLVVVHVSASGISVLPQILSRAGRLRARHARHGEALAPGVVYVATPDHHLLVREDGVALNRGPQENGHRPAIDVLFRSAARAFGPRMAAVVLSGALDDGAAGLATVKGAGGVAIVQDPADAAFPGMPTSALARVDADHVAPAEGIADVLVALVTGAAAPGDVGTAAGQRATRPDPVLQAVGGYSCPDCGGVLQPDPADGVMRCRVGHAWASTSLLAAQATRVEDALWAALRTLEERVNLSTTLAAAAAERNHTISAGRFEDQAKRFEAMAAAVRDLLDDGTTAESAVEDGGAEAVG